MAKHYGVYFTDHNNRTFELPIMPAEVYVDRIMDVAQNTVVKLGEVDRIGERKLNEFEIEGTIPVLPKSDKLTTANTLLDNGRDYIELFEAWQSSKKAGRFVITADREMSGRITISKFKWGMKDGNSNEFYFVLTFREWRDYAPKRITIQNNKVADYGEGRPAPANKLGVGSRVIVNGQLHRDSYGMGPGLTERNAERVISLVAAGRAYPYHVALVGGGARGWVTASSVRLV